MIQLFNIPSYKIDTSNFSNLLHDKVVKDFEENFCSYVGAKHGVSINSATSGIFLMLLGIEEKFVEVPSIIPPVVPNAILHSGCYVSFYDDIDWVGDSYVMHKTSSYKIIDSAQKVEKDQFKKEADANDLMLFSFYPTKPIGSCDGGIIVSDDLEKIEKLRELTLNGMTYADNNWERVQKSVGYKMYMNSLQAFICNENLKKLDEKNERLSYIQNKYNEAFGTNNTSFHLYRLRVKNNKEFISDAKKHGIMCGVHYEPCHINPIFNRQNQDLPKSILEGTQSVSIPFHENLSDLEIDKVIEYVKTNQA